MIELKDISVTFQSDQNKDIRAVQNVDLQVAPGDVYGIVGYSGAGKSTLVRTINLLQPPTSGQVIVHDQVLTNMSEEKLREARKKIGMIFQHFNLMDSRTIFDNVAFPLKRSQLSRIEINQKVAELLELVGLEDKAFSYPSQLSGGQKQRLSMANDNVGSVKFVYQTINSYQRNFKVINPRTTNTMAIIQKRATTCVSFQPSSSKW